MSEPLPPNLLKVVEKSKPKGRLEKKSYTFSADPS